jgi:Fe-S-cluster containining protein
MQPPTPSHLVAFAAKTDHWFQRASAALLNQLPCRAGCAQCCIGVFPITRLDARLLHEGLARLPADERTRIADRAREQVAALEAAEPRLASSPSLDGWADEDIDRVVNAFHDVPCPALSENRLCSLYAFRPLTCRSMGIPTREAAMVNGACDVQTFVPIVRLSESLEAEEQTLAQQESVQLAALTEATAEGEEVFLPYGFVSCDTDRRPRPGVGD